MAHEVGSLIDHEAAALHPDGVAAAEVRVKVRAVVAALIAPTLEVLVLVKDNLVGRGGKKKKAQIMSCKCELCLMTCFSKERVRILFCVQHKNILRE